MCATNATRIYELSIGEMANISCDVNASPSNVTFNWKFMNTREEQRKSETHSNALYAMNAQQIKYSVSTATDYGTLFCEASNRVGKTPEMCAFRILPRKGHKLDTFLMFSDAFTV
ncbi:neuronal growth regulator 1-like protein [Leptotrombidium deliense]|uniref:Neuronal growth regulator 1-like protein n=1 Tax=Leptotrombidium deliense TaxID=299467 RepID=A0A443SVJ9_9ACAR|nr:neuronal growth regulator 1-like protein [Leptotrombidium deliense]